MFLSALVWVAGRWCPALVIESLGIEQPLGALHMGVLAIQATSFSGLLFLPLCVPKLTSTAFHSTAKSLCCCCFSGPSLLFKSRASFDLIAIDLVLTACLAKENQPFINNETYYIGSQESHKIEVVATWLFNEKQ